MEERLPFALALIGGIFAALGALGTGAAFVFMSAFLPRGIETGFPLEFLSILFGWIFLASAGSAVASLVGAVKLFGAPRSRSGATWAIVGGSIGVLAGNIVSAALGITAGVLALIRPEAEA